MSDTNKIRGPAGMTSEEKRKYQEVQMKENTPTPETVSTPPPLTPKDSLSVEVEEMERSNQCWECPEINRLIEIVKELRKEIAEHKRLEKELNYILHPKEDFPKEPSFCDLVAYVKSDLATAQEENKKLRGALERILADAPYPSGHVFNIARAALADGKEGEK